MSTSTAIAEAAAAQIKLWPGLPAGLKVLARKKSDPHSKENANVLDAVEASLDNLGACIFVFRPIPKRVSKGTSYVFVENGLLTVRIIDKPEMNKTGMDAEDLLEAVQLCLQWNKLGGVLTQPLMIDNPPIAEIETDEERIIDAFFQATYQINP